MNSAAPPMPDSIAVVATPIATGNMNQYLVQSRARQITDFHEIRAAPTCAGPLPAGRTAEATSHARGFQSANV